jgi:hypothetical protein
MRRRAALATLILGFTLAIGASGSAGAQGKKNSATTRAATGRGTGTSDQNIKTAKAANAKGRTIAAPVKKGGTRSRGSDLCEILADNRTGLYVDLYTDGVYRGTVSPYGDLGGWVECGRRILYARADFDDGTYVYWGPIAASVTGPFLWTISR